MSRIHDRSPRNRVFVLRCCRARGERLGQPGTWRFGLECVQEQEKRGFPELAALESSLEDDLHCRAHGLAERVPADR